MGSVIKFKFGGKKSGYGYRITYLVSDSREYHNLSHIIIITSYEMNINPNIFIEVLSKMDLKEFATKYPRWRRFIHSRLDGRVDGFEDITNLFGIHEKVTIYYATF